ncbi:DUF4870 domain-containing protein [Bacillus sp. FJAT-29790]|uniref:DUF4870 domain-containing protein n=1 Tax=Bacillus sp. FJAT-29790 TaxID=1895002 RepID=UPI001C221467|nr:DUF4870 domain-containing protein [Bacillus sp. FJAT-29790]MBU8880943.1 DUF4870 domain-containing protein [Bacillus sp. FJAT-29790]
METSKVLSALSYFSILFAGFIFPLVVFLVTEDKVTKDHAKKAFLSHLIPLFSVPFVFIPFIFQNGMNHREIPIFFIVGIVLYILLSLFVLIWNIIKGVKVLAKESN